MICGIDEAGRGPLAGPVCAAAVVLPEQFPSGFPPDLLNDSKKLTPKRREEARRVILDMAVAWGVGWASHTEIDEINILQASLLAMRRAFDCMRRVHAPPLGAKKGDVPGDKYLTKTTYPVEPKVRACRGVVDCLVNALPPGDPAQSGGGIWPLCLETEVPFGRPFAGAVIPAGLCAVADGLHAPVLPIPCTALVKADASVREVMAASILAKTARDQLMEYYDRLYPEYGYAKHKGYPTPEHRERVIRCGPSPIQRKTFRVV